MKEYCAENLKTIDVDRHIIRNQEMYFGPEGANAEKICANVMDGALILGAEKVQTITLSGWHIICGTPDWFGMVEIPYKDQSKLFTEICGFPEAGVNSCRSEVMVRVFSEQSFTFFGGELEVISGSEPESPELKNILSNTGNWSRIIAFKFRKNV